MGYLLDIFMSRFFKLSLFSGTAPGSSRLVRLCLRMCSLLPCECSRLQWSSGNLRPCCKEGCGHSRLLTADVQLLARASKVNARTNSCARNRNKQQNIRYSCCTLGRRVSQPRHNAQGRYSKTTGNSEPCLSQRTSCNSRLLAESDCLSVSRLGSISISPFACPRPLSFLLFWLLSEHSAVGAL